MVSDSQNSYRGRVADLGHRAIADRIAECLRRGELLDLAPDLALGSLADEGVMRSWDGTRSIAAEDLRNLLRGRVVTDPDPRGLRLRGARIRGRLDLDNLTTTVKLTLLDCLLDEGITAEAAHLPGLSLRRCLLTPFRRSRRCTPTSYAPTVGYLSRAPRFSRRPSTARYG
jgi:hypothetical protein